MSNEIKNANLPASPIEINGFGHYAPEVFSGLTKREMFAMHAMQSMLSSKYVNDFNAGDADLNIDLCAKAVGYADALLKELEK